MNRQKQLEAMSDRELNTKYVGSEFYCDCEDSETAIVINEGFDTVDYCNNMANIWPEMWICQVGITPPLTLGDRQRWTAKSHNGYICSQANPLRAALIVLIMMDPAVCPQCCMMNKPGSEKCGACGERFEG